MACKSTANNNNSTNASIADMRWLLFASFGLPQPLVVMLLVMVAKKVVDKVIKEDLR
jgi:hypothetical protein